MNRNVYTFDPDNTLTITCRKKAMVLNPYLDKMLEREKPNRIIVLCKLTTNIGQDFSQALAYTYKIPYEIHRVL